MPSAPRDVGVFANSPAISKLVAKIQNPSNNRPDHLAIKIIKKSGLGNPESMGWLVITINVPHLKLIRDFDLCYCAFFSSVLLLTQVS